MHTDCVAYLFHQLCWYIGYLANKIAIIIGQTNKYSTNNLDSVLNSCLMSFESAATTI
jgi:hypothetical protein